MAQLRGQLAAHQLSKGSHVLAHQLRTSELFREEPWPPILTDDRVTLAIYDRCMCELLDVGGQERTTQRETKQCSLHQVGNSCGPFETTHV